MRMLLLTGALGVAFAVQACDRPPQPGAEAPEAPTGAPPAGVAAPTPTHQTTGRIASVAADAVTIDHEAVAAIGWPAMTMTFRAPDPQMLQGLETGQAVGFSFRQEGNDYVVTEIRAR